MRAVVGQQLPIEDMVDLEEALAETGNIILNSWVATLANLLKQRLIMSLPIVIRRDQHHIFENAKLETTVILFLHIKFDIRSKEIGGYVALMMDVPSIGELRSLICEFVASITRPDA